ncbi:MULTISPECIES: 2-oxo-tetronate isomerase [Symbiopectobacterium]|uniref:2-oxo-tetronate isomerase n=1 Tax=Symbiopectobacterium TaxID=801 RepID=UPI001A3277A2|nr:MULTISPECIES: 2-oxo-tetronate isomerase [Symbiopectobacterium]MBG6248343.1 hydroxypyruvate isomerase family protein [Candidatus Symbiopectobacterium sp. PLON1]MBT9430251.1 hydroxypyruvate isomerase family protein [Candidatus Symbiopectobacterium endolongispinus]
MPRFAANLSMLFTEVPFLARFEAAARAGFSAVEFLFPYAYQAEDIGQELRRNGLQLALFNVNPGDYAGGERGLAVLPGREREFKETLEQALDYAGHLGCGKLHVMSGNTPASLPIDETTALWLANMRLAADRLAQQQITLLCEALNPRDAPGYFLHDQRLTDRLVSMIDRPNARVQLDLYHAQITHGDLSMLIRSLAGRIGHVQIASVPDRHEPVSREINYAHIFRELEKAGYRDWIGCEYHPESGTHVGLIWRKAFDEP